MAIAKFLFLRFDTNQQNREIKISLKLIRYIYMNWNFIYRYPSIFLIENKLRENHELIFIYLLLFFFFTFDVVTQQVYFLSKIWNDKHVQSVWHQKFLLHSIIIACIALLSRYKLCEVKHSNNSCDSM